MWKLMAFVLPLGLDSFAVASALGTRPEIRRRRWRLLALIVVFEAGMPLVGLALGAPVTHLIAPAAPYLASGALAATGVWMICSDDGGDEERARELVAADGWALIALGLSISVDELAIGFSLGLARLPVVWVIVAIAVQAFIAAQLGWMVGARIGEAWRERAEGLAGLMLILLGGALLVAHVVG